MNELTIGYIELIEECKEFLEAEVGRYNINNNGGEIIRISVYTDEGDYIPHFHFYSKSNSNKKRTVDGCVKLLKPEYFSHGDHDSTLTNSQCKILNKWMSKKSSKMSNMTNWQYAIFIWNTADHNDIKIGEKPSNSQPDYSKLNKDVYYKVTTKDGIGIYEAFAKAAGSSLSKIIKSDEFKIIPAELYKNNSKKFLFTQIGYDIFKKEQMKTISQYIDPDYIVSKEVSDFRGKIIYENDYVYIIK